MSNSSIATTKKELYDWESSEDDSDENIVTKPNLHSHLLYNITPSNDTMEQSHNKDLTPLNNDTTKLPKKIEKSNLGYHYKLYQNSIASRNFTPMHKNITQHTGGKSNDVNKSDDPNELNEPNEPNKSDEDNKTNESIISPNFFYNKINWNAINRNSYPYINCKDYPFKSWKTLYPNGGIKLIDLLYNIDWLPFFEDEFKKPYYDKMEKSLEQVIKDNEDKDIYPFPELVFYALNTLSPKDINVIFIGQDPYHSCDVINGKKIPHAMGAAFSIPTGICVPSSLLNIYKNMTDNKILNDYPTNGNFFYLISQGCFFINTALTVTERQANSHSNIWYTFTKNLFKWLGKNLDSAVIVLWGNNALSMKEYFSDKKFKFVISSHPSGLSVNKSLRNYPPFSNVNQFGEINKYLNEIKKTQILPLF
jgi:uracil-DNA glycosylase